jgi:membrane protein DedA with SNARE-associated domain
VRVAAALRTFLLFGVLLRLHNRIEGPPIDYAGLASAAAASWVGIPGPGEPILVAAGVLAAKNRLDIGAVLFVAFAAATAGGVAGWVLGMKAGRAVITTRGPLQNMRRSALARGEEVFAKHPIMGVLLTPSWIAGILRVRTRIFLPVNAASAALWAVGIGLGAYYVGPTIVDFVDDLGWITAIGIALLVIGGVATEVSRRRRRDRRAEATAASQTTRTS